MKKTIVLLTIVLALIAAPVFAETGFSGSVDYKFGTNFTEFGDEVDNDSAISLDGKVGEFSVVSVSIEANEEGYDGTEDQTAKVTNLVLSQDVTGALGLSSPVTFAYALGVQSFEPADYSEVAGYGEAGLDAETATGLALVATFGVTEMFMLDVAAFPKTYFGAAHEFAVNAYGTISMVDYSAYYQLSAVGGDMVGANMGLVIDALSVGAALDMILTDAMNSGVYGVAAQYTIEAFTAGLAFGSAFANVDTGMTFSDVSAIGVNLNYDITEAATVWAAVKMPFADISDNFGYEAGIEAGLDGVTYGIGWTDASDYKAFDAGLGGNLFVEVSAAF